MRIFPVNTDRIGDLVVADGNEPVGARSKIIKRFLYRRADGNAIGEVTSGGYGPSVEGPIAMGYVKAEFSETDTKVNLRVRGKALPGSVVKLPFVDQRYYKS